MSWVPGTLRIPNNKRVCRRVQKGEYIKLQAPANINQKQTPDGNLKKMTKVKEQTSRYDCAAGGGIKNLRGIKTRKSKKSRSKAKKTNTVHQPKHPSSPAASSSRGRRRKGVRQKKRKCHLFPHLHPVMYLGSTASHHRRRRPQPKSSSSSPSSFSWRWCSSSPPDAPWQSRRPFSCAAPPRPAAGSTGCLAAACP